MAFTQQEIGDGIRLHTLETDKFTTMTMKVFIQQDLSEEKVAATALIPMIVRRGSQKYQSTKGLARKMEELYGANFGGDILKIGERQIVEYFFDMPSAKYLPDKTDITAEGITTFWEIITTPLKEGEGFNQQFFAQEKTNLTREVEGLINNKRRYALQKATMHMCAEEPFRLFKYGDIENIEPLDPVGTYEYYQDLLTTHPIDVFLVGPNAAHYGQLIKDLPLSRGSTVKLKRPVNKQVDQAKEVKEARNVAQAILVMGFRSSINYLSSNYYSLIVYNGILGGFPHSKLFLNVREKASLAYFVGSSLEGSKGLITVTAGIDGKNYQQALDIISAQAAALSEGEISEDELIRTKKGIISGMESTQDSPVHLIDRNVIGMANNHYRDLSQIVTEIEQVTSKSVQEVAKQIQLDTVYLLHGTEGVNQ